MLVDILVIVDADNLIACVHIVDVAQVEMGLAADQEFNVCELVVANCNVREHNRLVVTLASDRPDDQITTDLAVTRLDCRCVFDRVGRDDVTVGFDCELFDLGNNWRNRRVDQCPVFYRLYDRSNTLTLSEHVDFDLVGLDGEHGVAN